MRDKSNGQIYAMKKLKKTEMVRRGQVDHVKAERNLLAEVHNESVVKLFYSFQDEDFLYLVMEYLPGKDTHDTRPSVSRRVAERVAPPLHLNSSLCISRDQCLCRAAV